MNYYTVSYSTNPREIGPEFPQVSPPLSYDFKGPRSYLNFSEHEFPKIEPDLQNFIIHPKSPLTDILSTGLSHGLVLSARLRMILEDFNLASHRYYPMSIWNGKNLHQYFWMFIVSDQTSWINIRKTRFFVVHIGKREIELDVSTMEELIEMSKFYIQKNRLIKSDSIHFNPEFLQLSLDLFVISRVDYSICISEKLNNILVKENVTGFKSKRSSLTFD